WTTGSVPGATTHAEVASSGPSNQGVQINNNTTVHAASLDIIGSTALVKDDGTLIVSGALTVLNGGALRLTGTLEAGSITGTITGNADATIVGPSGAGSSAEIITAATISEASTKTISGSLFIDSGAILTLTGGTHAENIRFGNNFPDNDLDSGKLVIGSGTTFTGTVSGFTAGGGFSDTIDVQGIDFTSAQFSQNYNAAAGVLSLADGSNSATIHFSGFGGTFHFASDGNHGTLITDPPADSGTTTVANNPTIVSGAEGNTLTGGGGNDAF